MNLLIPTTTSNRPTTVVELTRDKVMNNVKAKTGTSSTSLRRDPLSNITNAVSFKNADNNTKKAVNTISVKNNLPKRQSDSENPLLLKKLKSDPMIIDEEENIVESPPQPIHEDIDIQDKDDPQAVVEYVNDIYKYLMEKEKDSVDWRYFSSQLDINEKMRAILVDWLVEVHRMFKLLPETLFMSISLIDRYLSVKQTSRDSLQLVGLSCMLIAAKYEEIYAPECNDFVYVSDGAYTKSQILQMEQFILNTLKFNITHPSALHFLRRFSKAGGSDYTLHTLCKYLIELVLIDVKFLRYPNSLIAAASVYLARMMISKTPLWNTSLEYYSTYSEIDVRECAVEINDHLKKSQNSSLTAIRRKYSLAKFCSVAKIPLVDL